MYKDIYGRVLNNNEREQSRYPWKENSLNKLRYTQCDYTEALKRIMQIMEQYFRYIYDWSHFLKKNRLHQHVCMYVHCNDKTQNTTSNPLRVMKLSQTFFFMFTGFSNLYVMNTEYWPKVEINMHILIECGMCH